MAKKKLWAMRNDQGKWGYIDNVKPIKDKYGSMNGFRLVEDWRIEPIFDMAKNFIDGSAIVKLNGKYGLIREDGSYIHEPQFKDAYSWEDYIIVCDDSENLPFTMRPAWGIMNRKGEWIEGPLYTFIERAENSNDYLEASYDGEDIFLIYAGFFDEEGGVGYIKESIEEDEEWESDEEEDYEN